MEPEITLGSVYFGGGHCRFKVWAPRVRRLEVHLLSPGERLVELEEKEGYHQATLEGMEPGSLYLYRFDGGLERPDPASRFQPRGMHSPSQVVDPAFAWEDQGWFGLPLKGYMLYEIHVGTFSAPGTFEGVISHLDELKELGITALELMPVAPDNRRPVDFRLRQHFLSGLKERIEKSGGNLVPLARELLENSWDGRIKLYLICRTLQARRRAPKVFSEGFYLPLEGEGEKKDHLCAFARIFREDLIVVGVPRLGAGLLGGREEPPLGEAAWKDTWVRIPGEWVGRKYRNLFTGEELGVLNESRGAGFSLGDLFGNFPVALLECMEPS